MSLLLPGLVPSKMGIGIGEKGNCREKSHFLRRWQWLWIFVTTAIVVTFLIQLAIYCTINDYQRSLVNNCAKACRENQSSFPNMRTPWFHGNASTMGQRKKFDAKRHKSDSQNSTVNAKSMLLIGGSDGSGTRAIVEVLRRLGTVIVSEDPHTFDVNANEIFHSSDGLFITGWPSLVERSFSNFGREGIFQSIRSSLGSGNTSLANFIWPPPTGDLKQKIEIDMANGIEADVNRLIESWNYKFDDLTHNQPSQKSYVQVSARDVRYAIKAPASMLVLPIFAHMQRKQHKSHNAESRPRLKFLHVVRDGRDVALSDNQSPVIKFYNLTYPLTHPRRESLASIVSSATGFGKHGVKLGDDAITHAKAIQLWNDWNINVYRWASDPKHSGEDVDYMWIRSEDLLVAGSQERLDALTALAHFVGSTISNIELCALGRLGTIDYGQSMRTAYRSILHSRAGAGESDILSRWEIQNRDAEKRIEEQQQQPGGRRLMEDKQIRNQDVIDSKAQDGTRETSRVRPSTIAVGHRYGKWKSIL